MYGRNKLVNAKAFINKPRTKASNAMDVRGTAATRRGESFWLSYKERRVDALALRADERRDKLRKASGRSKYPLIRRYLNGETRLSKPQSLHGESIAMQGEPSELKHLSRAGGRERNIDSQSSGERNGKSPNQRACMLGLRTAYVNRIVSGTVWEVRPERVKAPYTKAIGSSRIQSTTRHEKPCGK